MDCRGFGCLCFIPVLGDTTAPRCRQRHPQTENGVGPTLETSNELHDEASLPDERIDESGDEKRCEPDLTQPGPGQRRVDTATERDKSAMGATKDEKEENEEARWFQGILFDARTKRVGGLCGQPAPLPPSDYHACLFPDGPPRTYHVRFQWQPSSSSSSTTTSRTKRAKKKTKKNCFDDAFALTSSEEDEEEDTSIQTAIEAEEERPIRYAYHVSAQGGDLPTLLYPFDEADQTIDDALESREKMEEKRRCAFRFETETVLTGQIATSPILQKIFPHLYSQLHQHAAENGAHIWDSVTICQGQAAFVEDK